MSGDGIGTIMSLLGDGMNNMICSCVGTVCVWTLPCVHVWATEWKIWFVRVWGRYGQYRVSMSADGIDFMVCPFVGTKWTLPCVHIGRWNGYYGLFVGGDGIDHYDVPKQGTNSTPLCP
jgi:hypothetical protein